MADRRVSVTLTADADPFVRAVSRAAQQTDGLARKAEKVDGKRIKASVTLDGAAKAAAEADTLSRTLAKIDGKHARARASVTGVDAAGKDVRVLMSSLVMLGPTAVAAAGVGSAALLGLGGAVTVLAGSVGVGVAAFQGIGDTIKAANDYALEPSAANASKLATQLDNLSWAGRNLVQYLGEVRPALSDLQRVAANGLLPGAEAGLRRLSALLPTIRDMVDDTATAAGRAADQFGRGLSTREWEQFVSYIGSRANPVLSDLTSITLNVAGGIAGVVKAFDRRLGDGLLDGLDRATERFHRFGQALVNSSGFERFSSYVEQTGPKLMSTLGAVAGAIAAVAEAASPLGPVLLGGIEMLARLIETVADSSVGTVLIGVAGGLAALNLGLKTLATIKAAPVVGLISGIASKAAPAAAGTGALGGALGALGPAAAIAAVATVGIAAGYEQIRDRADDAAQSVIDGSQTMHDAILEEAEVIQKRNDLQRSQQEIIDEGQESLRAVLSGNREATITAEEWAEAEGKIDGKLREKLAKMEPLERITAEVTIAQSRYVDAVNKFGDDSPQAIQAANDLAIATSADAQAHRDAAWAAKDQMQQLAALIEQEMAAVDADLGLRQAKIDLKQAQERYTTAVREHGAGSDEAARAGLNLEQAEIRVESATRRKAEATTADKSATEQASAQVLAHGDALAYLVDTQRGKATPALQQMTEDFSDAELASYNASVEVSGLDYQVRKLPDGREIKVTTSGVQQTLDEIGKVQEKILKINGRDVPIFVSPLGQGGIASAGRLAAGGYVTGPGTATSDSIPTWLSNGEYVIRAAAVRQIGVGTLDAINSGRSSVVPAAGYAAGGLVAPNPLNVEFQPSGFAEFIKNMTTAMSGGPAPAGSGPIVAQVQAVAARYGWGAGLQWDALSWLISHESGWRPTAQNPTSTAYGLFQFLNSTWGTVGGSKTSNPAQQAEYGLRYIRNRYGSPLGAKAFWTAHRWYDEGGVARGKGVMAKATLEPERVLSPRQTAAFERLVDELTRPRRVPVPAGAGAAGAVGGGGDTYNLYQQLPQAADAKEVTDRVMFQIRSARRRFK
ncbi:transglycosylase SLT domain-containing protein [Pseudonocardia sp. RS010]|uniref:aggregation-promoting factor C-terminal-like domain-containing protein n=1 Tax=Pseudonocardia sp. RS010 TaxID=3385979 RepID=UPI0039A0D37B